MLYYWSRMRLDIIQYIENCTTCAENFGSVSRPVPVQSYPIPSEPWDTVAIDLLTLPLTTDGHMHLLVAIDHFSRFSVLVPLKDKQAKSVARALIDEVFCKYNTPKVLLSRRHMCGIFNQEVQRNGLSPGFQWHGRKTK